MRWSLSGVVLFCLCAVPAAKGTTPPTLSVTCSTSPCTGFGNIGETESSGTTLTVGTSDPTQPIAFKVSTSSGGGIVPPWLIVSPTSGDTGTTPTLEISTKLAGFAPGRYSGSITIKPTSSTANGSVTVDFTVTAQGTDSLQVAPSPDVSQTLHLSTPSATGTIAVTSSPSLPGMYFRASANVQTPPAGNWLSVTQNGNQTNSTVSVSAQPGSLAPGTYNGSVTVTDTINDQNVVPVAFTVLQPPKLTATCTTSCTGSGATGQSISLGSIDVTSSDPNQPITFTDTLNTSNVIGPTWLSVGNTGGTAGASTFPLTLVANLTGLAAGTYSGSVTITASSPPAIRSQTLAATATVTSGSLVVTWSAGSLQNQNSSQVLALTAPSVLTGTVNVAASTGALYYSYNIQAGASWLTASPQPLSSPGALTPGAITLTASASGLSAGTYQGQVNIIDSANNMTPVRVSLTVPGAPPGQSGTQVTAVLPHIAAGASFVTDFYVVNSGSVPADFSITFHGDDGSSISLPFSGLGSLSTLSDTVPANGLKFYESGTSGNPNLLSGWGLVTSDPSITIQALFRRQVSDVYYEAAVPTTAAVNSFQLPFDATTFTANDSQLYTGFAIANADSSTAANVTCTALDFQGAAIPGAVAIRPLSPNGHWAGYNFPLLVGNRGTISCTSNTTVGPLALRALGADALSTLPIITTSTVFPTTTVLPHIAAGGSFVTDLYLLNTAGTSANFSISFHDDLGQALSLPFSGIGSLSTLSGSVPPNGLKFYEAGVSSDPNLLDGSGLMTADPSITIQALFRRAASNNYYEATVPASAGSHEFEIPFDATVFAGNDAQIFTGFAIANLDAGNTATVTCTARDSQGTVIPNAVQPVNLSPSGHWGNYQFPLLVGLQGTINCVSTTNVGAVALRALGADAISTLPVIALPLRVPVSLTGVYNITGIFSNGTVVSGNGGLDGLGYAYSGSQLGASLIWNGSTFTFGSPGVPNAVASQVIPLPGGQFTRLDMLGTGVDGAQASQTIVVRYSDGSTTSFTQSFSDWYAPQTYPNETEVATMAYRDTGTGGTNSGPLDLYGYSFVLDSKKTVSSITLPTNPHVVVLAMTLVGN